MYNAGQEEAMPEVDWIPLLAQATGWGGRNSVPDGELDASTFDYSTEDAAL